PVSSSGSRILRLRALHLAWDSQRKTMARICSQVPAQPSCQGNIRTVGSLREGLILATERMRACMASNTLYRRSYRSDWSLTRFTPTLTSSWHSGGTAANRNDGDATDEK